MHPDFIDSITISKYIEKNQTVIDIGTGAGFPGIPLKILNKENKFILFDSLNKRLKVLQDIIEKIKLDNTICFGKVRINTNCSECFSR